MITHRNIYLDFIKAILIFLVSLGHSIQIIGYRNNPLFWDDYLFKFIYTFHMPLFIGISGYLSYTSIKKRALFTYTKNKILYLLIPMLSWCLITFSISGLINNKINLNQLIEMFAINYWFIWAILLYSFIIVILAHFKLDNVYILMISAILLMVLPLESYGYSLIKSMYPFFVLGYISAQIDLTKIISLLKKYLVLIIIFSVISFFIWNKNIYPYITPSNFTHLKITIFRLIASTSISITILFAFFYIYKKIQTYRITNFIVSIGKETLGLYLIQGTLFYAYTTIFSKNDYFVYNNLACCLISIIYIVIFYYLIKFFSKIKFLRTILFGKK